MNKVDEVINSATEIAKELEISIHNTLSEIENLKVANPRWLAIAKTDLEKGLLALNHALQK